MNMLGCFLIFCLLLSTVDAQITISADKSLPRDGETVNLICSVPSFIVPATWSVNTNGVSLTVCRPSGPCLPSNDAARYTYSATASSISVTITSFNSNIDTFGWRCQYGTNSAVYVIKPAVPVTTVQLTNTSGEILTSTINVLKGGITYIRCSTAPSGSRPHATFCWYNRSMNQSPVLIGNQSISSTPDAIMVPGQSEPDLVISYSTLTLIGVTFYQNVYVLCEARDETNTGNYIQSGEVQLNMVYPPVVQLSPNYSMYNVTEGTQNFVFNCNIIEANPLPQSNGYSWFHKSVVMQGQTSSSYTLPSVQKSHDGEYICTARNEFGNGTSNALALNVQYSPTVNPFTSPLKVIQGQPLEVVCSAHGNPSPQLTWSPAGEDRLNKSRLYYSAISRDKAVIHTCTATNNMVPTIGNPQAGSDSKDLLTDVLYTPIVNPFISPVKVIAGLPLEVVCFADGNPSPHLTWSPAGEDRLNMSRLYYSAISRDRAVVHTCTATNNMVPTIGSLQLGSDSKDLLVDVLYSPTVSPIISPIKVIQGQPLELVCSADGNPSPQITWNPAGADKVNRSRLYYSAISRDKAVVHTCTAKNNMVPTMGSLQLGSDSKDLLIDVLYAPVVNPFTSPVKVIQGQPLELVCSADGNPSPQMTWNPAGEDRLNMSRLYYSAISRDKAVIHTCTATNNMVPTMGSPQLGSDSKDLLIDVLYNASISRFTSKDNISLLNENSSLKLLCKVDSNPYAVISLYFENDLKLEMKNAMNLSYTITSACLDAGKYTCSARNSVMNGDAVSRNIQINVTCQPRSDHRRNISTVHYGSLGDNVTLEVYVIAYPDPTDITWYHGEKETEMWQMFPYQSPSSNGLYSSIIIHIATQSDFGYYLVNMSNDFGIYNEIYHILPESNPGVPLNFAVTLSGSDSVKLEWTPGFGGGHPQYFIIKYKALPDGAWIRYGPIWDSGLIKQSVTITGLQQKTTYEFHLYAENRKGPSENTGAIVITTEQRKFDSPEFSVAGLAGGLSAGIVIILVVGIGIFLWRRYQLTKHNGHDEDTKMEHEESTRKKQIKLPSVRQDMGSGREYEGLHFTDIEVTQYQQLCDTAPENHRNPDARSPENDSYEKLHPYANSDIQMYSSLKIPEISKDSQKDYENTWIET